MYDDRSIPKFEVDILILEEFNADQVEQIFNIMEILGRYMLVDRDMLFEIYEKKYSKKMGISYLRKAVKEKLVIEYKYNYEQVTEQEVYFYQLKDSGFYALDRDEVRSRKLPFSASSEQKSRVLGFNTFAIKNNYTPSLNLNLPKNLSFFLADDNKICYFSDIISLEKIEEFTSQYPKIQFTLKEITEKYDGHKTKAVNPKYN